MNENLSIIKLKQIFWLINDFKFVQHVQVFFPKRSCLMMLLLIHNVFYHDIAMASAVGKCSIPLLPLKFSINKLLLINPSGGIGFYFLN